MTRFMIYASTFNHSHYAGYWLIAAEVQVIPWNIEDIRPGLPRIQLPRVEGLGATGQGNIWKLACLGRVTGHSLRVRGDILPDHFASARDSHLRWREVALALLDLDLDHNLLVFAGRGAPLEQKGWRGEQPQPTQDAQCFSAGYFFQMKNIFNRFSFNHCDWSLPSRSIFYLAKPEVGSDF